MSWNGSSYTVEEAAQLLCYSRKTLYSYIKDGLIEATRDEHGHLRITSDALGDFRRKLPNPKREELIAKARRRELAKIAEARRRLEQLDAMEDALFRPGGKTPRR